MANKSENSEAEKTEGKDPPESIPDSVWHDELRGPSANDKDTRQSDQSVSQSDHSTFLSGAVSEAWSDSTPKGAALTALRKESARWEETLSAGPADGGKVKADKNERLMLDGFYLLDQTSIAQQKPLDRGNEIKVLMDRAKFSEIAELRDLPKFAEIGKEIIRQINPSKMAVTKEELAQALQNPSFKGEKAQVLAAMYHTFDQIRNISNHEWFFQSRRIAASDLDMLPSLPKKQQDFVDQIVEASLWSDKNFSKYAGKDGLFHAEELKEAMKTPDLLESDRQHLKTISQLLAKYSDGVNPSQLNQVFNRASADTAETRLFNRMYDAVKRTALARNESKGESRLYPSFPQGINPDAIKQGLIGNCYFIAALSAVAKADPGTIRDSIQDNKNGTYTVTFKGAPDQPVTVSAPTEAEMGLYNSGRNNGVWATVMEKAYGEMRNRKSWIPAYTPQDALDGGGYTGEALKLVTGNSVFSLAATGNEEALDKTFDLAFRGGRRFLPVTAVTLAPESSAMPGRTKDGFVRGHAFTVVGYDRDEKGNGSLVIQNPWAGKNGTPDGRVKVPLAKAIKNFHMFDFSL